ncbi:cytochrome P450 family protein [Rhizoctonia solani]|uniref:Cytochrome P450 family protein n=1 Tax=Rhizoctonia solani TaxID=456999 RepID=A0A8H8SX40_9AGAM|nr:cytochrome P450 family protein [Rhizoctonia solani]QRW20999.1 cytochrome P450 family protein [Rhizoctonia solani]
MSRRTQKLPPSPQSDPLIGHLRLLPTSDEHRVYARWGKELNSDIVSITVLGQTTVVLNSTAAVNELFDRRSTIYSSRVELPMITYPDLVDWSKFTSFLPYGDRWRAQRRMSHKVLHKKATMEIWPVSVKHSRMALQRISTNPDAFIREIRRMTGSILLSAVYGYEVTSANDHLVELVELALDHLCDAAIQGNFLVNTIPCLRYLPDWLPGTGWKKTAKAWSEEKDEMINAPFYWTKQRMTSGSAPHSIVGSLLGDLQNNSNLKLNHAEEEEDIIKWVAGNMFGAGADTVDRRSLLVFILAMTLNPRIQAKAQAEVDRVLGQDRLPEMDDRESLPYVECVLKEVERWQPVTPIGSVENDEYCGYFIPKGAAVVGNVWAIAHDESVYPEPDRFNPDRFLDPRVPKALHSALAEVHLAESTLFITISTFLMLFDVRPIKDEEGKEILPEVNMKTNALVSYPADFRCSITPRSERALKLLGLSVLGTDG